MTLSLHVPSFSPLTSPPFCPPLSLSPHLPLSSRVQPHMSYDIDGDGFVSQEDLKIGKTIDVNNDGVIQDNEKQMGVVKMARVRFTLRRHTSRSSTLYYL